MTFEHFPIDPTTFKTIPEELSHLKPKAQGKTTNRRLCGGGYSPAVDSPQGEVAGPKGTGTANGQDYYGVEADEGCKPDTALACGTIECTA